MTKDGRSSRLCDIRYFAGDIHKYLGDDEVTAFGRRLAWWLNAESLTLGPYTALYIFFSPSITEGAIHVTDYGGDWWQRYTHVGVPRNFPNVPNGKEIAIEGTIAALKAIRPDKDHLIDQAAKAVKTKGEQTRFLIKTKERKDYRIDIAISIGVWRNRSHFHVSLTDQKTGEFLDAPGIPILFPDHGFDLAGSVSLVKGVVQLKAHPSFTANFTAEQYEWPPHLPISAFSRLEKKPVYSRLVSRRGWLSSSLYIKPLLPPTARATHQRHWLKRAAGLCLCERVRVCHPVRDAARQRCFADTGSPTLNVMGSRLCAATFLVAARPG